MTQAENQKRWRYKKGISKRKQLSQLERNYIHILRYQGETLSFIAKKFNRSIECIRKVTLKPFGS